MSKDAINGFAALAAGSRVVLTESRSLNRRLLLDWLRRAWPGCRIEAVAVPASLPPDPSPVALALFSFGRERITAPSVAAAILALRACIGDAPLVLLGEREDRAVVADALAVGASGYVPTSFDALTAIRAIEFVLAGGIFVPAMVLAEAGRRGADDHGGHRGAADALPLLTPREQDVAALICAGKPNKIIAHELQISEATVKVFVSRLLSKLGVSNRTEAASALRRHHGDGDDLRRAIVGREHASARLGPPGAPAP